MIIGQNVDELPMNATGSDVVGPFKLRNLCRRYRKGALYTATACPECSRGRASSANLTLWRHASCPVGPPEGGGDTVQRSLTIVYFLSIVNKNIC